MNKTTNIILEGKDTAIVLRESGKSELYLRKLRDNKSQATPNEVLVYIISELLQDQKWIESQVNYYETKGDIDV